MTDEVIELALKQVYKNLDEFITQCRKEGGPTKGDIAKIRAVLPSGYENSYEKKSKD